VIAKHLVANWPAYHHPFENLQWQLLHQESRQITLRSTKEDGITVGLWCGKLRLLLLLTLLLALLLLALLLLLL
jgi:hypothetical protein